MTVIKKIILSVGNYLLLCFTISHSMESVPIDEIQRSPNMNPLSSDAITYMITFLPHKDLVSFSQSNQENRKLCFPSKLNYFLSVFILPDPGQDAYFVAKYLKKIALAERFIYSLIPINNPGSYKDQIQIYKENNESTKSDVLEIAKNMHYSLIFRLMNGPLYLSEITNQENFYKKPTTNFCFYNVTVFFLYSMLFTKIFV